MLVVQGRICALMGMSVGSSAWLAARGNFWLPEFSSVGRGDRGCLVLKRLVGAWLWQDTELVLDDTLVQQSHWAWLPGKLVGLISLGKS